MKYACKLLPLLTPPAVVVRPGHFGVHIANRADFRIFDAIYAVCGIFTMRAFAGAGGNGNYRSAKSMLR
jgi:hypothetical protein